MSPGKLRPRLSRRWPQAQAALPSATASLRSRRSGPRASLARAAQGVRRFTHACLSSRGEFALSFNARQSASDRMLRVFLRLLASTLLASPPFPFRVQQDFAPHLGPWLMCGKPHHLLH
jgi:hypothetical protein